MGSVLFFAVATMAVLCLEGSRPSGPDGDTFGHGRQGRTRNHFQIGARTGYERWPDRAGPVSDSISGVSSVPLLLELLGTGLDSGLTIQSSLQVVADVSDQDIRECLLRVVAGLEIGASWHNSWEGNLFHRDVARIHDALSFGALTGASAAPLLYAEAQQCRTAAARTAEKRAAALGVKLVLPLGLCSLPAFIALGVVPVVMAMIPVF